jgi:hypothetical protein
MNSFDKNNIYGRRIIITNSVYNNKFSCLNYFLIYLKVDMFSIIFKVKHIKNIFLF